MAKPNASKAGKANAKEAKADKHASAKPAPRGGKNEKPASAKIDAPATDKKAAAPFSVPASEEVTAVVTRMNEKGLQWFQSLKPLKVVAEPVVAASSSKRNKHKQQQPPAKTLDESKLHALSETQVQDKKRHAQRLLEAEVRRHDDKKSGKLSSDDKYLATMMSKGTLADRVAALTLTIQGAPFHSLARLGQLITMATKKARRESMMAVESLKDLFINNLLPDDRKLNFFHQNPLDHPDVTDAHLVVWFYEHCLKTAFAQLVGTLSAGMADAVDNHKRACIRAANALLAAKPEQEAVLLGMLVNKIGDPDRKIAAYIHKTLQELLKEHPLMKRVVVDEVERLLTRAQVSDRTKYNAVLFLNQIMLRKDDDDDAALAAHLIKVFFALFSKEVHGAEEAEKKRQLKAQHKASKKAAKGKAASATQEGGGSMDRKLLSALLMGVNRAFPYSRTATSADLQEEIDTLFKVVRLAKHFPTSVHAMMLLFQVMHSTNSVSDRFYTALYEKLFDPKLRETSKHTLFLNLVFKALKADVSPARSSAFVKRLLQLTSVMTPAFTCAVLFLLSEVMKIKPQLRTLFDQPEAGSAGGNGGKDDEHFTDKDSESDEKPNVFNPDEEADEEDKDKESNGEDDDSEMPEALNDGVSDADRTARVLAEMFGKSTPADEPEKPRAAKSFDDNDTVQTPTTATADVYDWRKRNPLFANAETSCAWEIHHLLAHYHPSVQQFAKQLVTRPGVGIQYAGDPLVDFTMHAFFEKFMNKKPRHKQQAPSQSQEGDSVGKNWTFVPINTEAVLQEAEESIDISDQFFYKFFKERAERDAAHPNSRTAKKKKAKRSERDDDAFSGDDDDEDEDEEVEAFAQQLAEGIMQDGDMDDEDPELDDWSGPEGDDDDDEDDGARLDGEDDDDDDDEAMAFGDDDEEDGEELDGGDDDDDEDSDEEDGLDFDAMDGELDLPKVAKQKAPPTAKGNKKKTTFADADDYEQIMRDALAKQKQQLSKKRTKDATSEKLQSKKSRKH
jgi:ribosome biogenesis protein MAK21